MWIILLLRLGPIGWVAIAKATVAGQHIWYAFFDCSISAVPFHSTGTGIHHRTPRPIVQWLGAMSIRAKCCRDDSRKHHPFHDFHLAKKPTTLRAARAYLTRVDGLILCNFAADHCAKRSHN